MRKTLKLLSVLLAVILVLSFCACGSDTELSKLMQDFFCTDPDKMNFKELSQTVGYYKKTEEGILKMCKVFDDIRKNAEERTSKKTKQEDVMGLIRLGKLTDKEIAKSLKIPIKEVREIAKMMA